MARWSQSPSDMSQGLKAAAEARVREMAFDIQGLAILGTPVDTGRLRGNWHVTVGQPSDRVSDGVLGFDSNQELASLALGQSIYIQNNVEYAVFVENGSGSRQPVKMLANAAGVVTSG